MMMVGMMVPAEMDRGAGNGGSGVVVLAKKVAKVSVLNDEGEVSETYLFNYDQEGRVSKIINQYGPGGGYQEEKNFFLWW